MCELNENEGEEHHLRGRETSLMLKRSVSCVLSKLNFELGAGPAQDSFLFSFSHVFYLRKRRSFLVSKDMQAFGLIECNTACSR